MRVPYDVVRDGLSAINEAASQMAAAQQQVSTGRRITRAGDDPAASQAAVVEHAAIANADAYSRTAGAAAGRLAAADSMLSTFGDKLAAVMVAALSAQGSSATAASRSAAADAVTGLRDSLLSDINTTFNGVSLSHAINIGAGGNVVIDKYTGMVPPALVNRYADEFKPDILVLAGLAEVITGFMNPFEDRLPDGGVDKPYYVFTDQLKGPDLIISANARPGLRGRVRGTRAGG